MNEVVQKRKNPKWKATVTVAANSGIYQSKCSCSFIWYADTVCY